MIFGAQLAGFKTGSWARGASSCELAQSVMTSIRSELDDFDVHAIAGRHARPITVRFGEGQCRSVDMSCVNALAFYDAGYQICVHELSRPVLREWCRHLSEALDVPDCFSCHLLAANTSHPTSMRFDPLEKFTVQLVGTDIWSVAANTVVPLPTASYDGTGQRHHEELGLFVKKFPIPPAEVTRGYGLTPGHMLYVPRGFWHAVAGASGQPSVSLVISCPAVSWADLIAPALRSLLLRDARWRENAKVLSPHASGEERSRFYSMVSEAAEQLSALDMSCLLPWTKSEPAPPVILIPNPLATLSYEDSHEAGHIRAISRVHLGPYSRNLEADIRADLQPVLEIVRRRNETPIRELQELVSGIASLEQALDTLRKLDLVRPKPAGTPGRSAASAA